MSISKDGDNMFLMRLKLLTNNRMRGLFFLFSIVFNLFFIILFFNLNVSQRIMLNQLVEPDTPDIEVEINNNKVADSTIWNASHFFNQFDEIENVLYNYSFQFFSTGFVLANGTFVDTYRFSYVAFKHEYFDHLTTEMKEKGILISSSVASYYNINENDLLLFKFNDSSENFELNVSVLDVLSDNNVANIENNFIPRPGFFFDMEMMLAIPNISKFIRKIRIEVIFTVISRYNSLDQMMNENTKIKKSLEDLIAEYGFDDYTVESNLEKAINQIKHSLSYYSSLLFISLAPLTLIFVFSLAIIGNATLEAKKKRLSILINRGIDLAQMVKTLMINLIFILSSSAICAIALSYILYIYFDLFFEFLVYSIVMIILFSGTFCLVYLYEINSYLKKTFEKHEIIYYTSKNSLNVNFIAYVVLFLLLVVFAFLFTPATKIVDFTIAPIISLMFQIGLIFFVLYILIFKSIRISLLGIDKIFSKLHRLGNITFRVLLQRRKLTKMLMRALIISSMIVFLLSSVVENLSNSQIYLANASFAGNFLWEPLEDEIINRNITLGSMTKIFSAIPDIEQFLPIVNFDPRFGSRLELLLDGYSAQFAIVNITAMIKLMHSPFETVKYKETELIEKIQSTKNGILTSKAITKEIDEYDQHYLLIKNLYFIEEELINEVKIVDTYFSIPLLNWTVNSQTVLLDFQMFNQTTTFPVSKIYFQVTNVKESRHIVEKIIKRAEEVNITLYSKEFATYEEYQGDKTVIANNLAEHMKNVMFGTIVALLIMILYVIEILLQNTKPNLLIMQNRGMHYKTIALLSSLAYSTVIMINMIIGFFCALPFTITIMLNSTTYKLYHFLSPPIKSIELFASVVVLNSALTVIYLLITLKNKFQKE